IDQIIDTYYPSVYAFTLTHVKSEAVAKDLTQDVFVQLIRRKSRLNEIENLESYVYTMTRNAIYRHFRKIRFSEEMKSEMLLAMSTTHSVTEANLEYLEMQEIMQQKVEELPDRQREIFHLSREMGLSHKEIAEKLNISPNTVKNHLVQALKTLRAGLELLKG